MRSGRTLILVVAGLTLYAIAPGTGEWARSVVTSAAQMYRHRNSTRETRAASLLGDAFLVVDEARRTTPPDARIVIPEGAEASPLSNRTWCDYYLHPRLLLTRSEMGAVRPVSGTWVIVYHGANLEMLGVPADSIRGTERGVFPMRVARGVRRPETPDKGADR